MADFAVRALNSRFCRFISRLGRNKFTVHRRREFGHKRLILLPVSGVNRGPMSAESKNSRLFSRFTGIHSCRGRWSPRRINWYRGRNIGVRSRRTAR